MALSWAVCPGTQPLTYTVLPDRDSRCAGPEVCKPETRTCSNLLLPEWLTAKKEAGDTSPPHLSLLPPPAVCPKAWGVLCQLPCLSPGGNFHLTAWALLNSQWSKSIKIDVICCHISSKRGNVKQWGFSFQHFYLFILQVGFNYSLIMFAQVCPSFFLQLNTIQITHLRICYSWHDQSGIFIILQLYLSSWIKVAAINSIFTATDNFSLGLTLHFSPLAIIT